MPLRDHFHAPLDDLTSWDGFHGGWPMVIVQHLARRLPRRYIAGPHLPCDQCLEIDTDRDSEAPTANWLPAQPTFSWSAGLPAADVYEVRVYDSKRGRQLVAAIEIVSPANKDRPEHRGAFVGKCAALLQQQVSVTIIDLVTNRNINLYGELLKLIGQTDPSLSPEPPPLYAVACRTTKRDTAWFLETWTHPPRAGPTAADVAAVAGRQPGHPAGTGRELRGNLPGAADSVRTRTLQGTRQGINQSSRRKPGIWR